MKEITTLFDCYLGRTLAMEVSSMFVENKYPAKTILLSLGQVAKELYFVKSGIIREWYIDKNTNEEYTRQFAAENTFFYSTQSYVSGLPTERSVDVVEECVLLSINKKKVEDLCREHHSVEHLMRVMVMHSMLQAEQREEINRIKSTEMKLNAFELLHPELQNRIPIKTLASYLCVSKENLSKTRGKRRQTRS